MEIILHNPLLAHEGPFLHFSRLQFMIFSLVTHAAVWVRLPTCDPRGFSEPLGSSPAPAGGECVCSCGGGPS